MESTTSNPPPPHRTQEEFIEAKTLKVGPDKPLEEVRFQVLSHPQKELLVPTPKLRRGLFNRLVAPLDCSQQELRALASRRGIDHDSKPVPIASRCKIDVVVVGSVAVDRFGRRLGKGEGFADLEYALAATNHGSAVGQDTVVITCVHDCQVFDCLPPDLFAEHDLPVDIIVTPTKVVRASIFLPKPKRIIWSLLTKEKLDQIEILREIQFKEKRIGHDVSLMDDVPVENPNAANTTNRKKVKKTKRQLPEAQKSKAQSTTDMEGWFTVFLGRIPRNYPPKDLQEVLAARGFEHNSPGINLVIKPVKGVAFLNMDPSVHQHDDVIKQLDGVCLGSTELNVQGDSKYTGVKAPVKKYRLKKIRRNRNPRSVTPEDELPTIPNEKRANEITERDVEP
ncbi:hypothetical protein TCAL_13360 [Tigriopus californicus]|uniref:Methenyltetrahydrofolate synthase domain-containing protein n=1 Tax=Tigriopus californicus TaxID=6832 RepID=A0A553PQC3_TIGCA|nr:hypothetical protein TCAL_13360 [Tigriopus californicus]